MDKTYDVLLNNIKVTALTCKCKPYNNNENNLRNDTLL